jgi:anhydro-N-acetylmuramic acid kinase
MKDALYVGLMSGTSVDAIDSALLRCGANGSELLHTHQHAIPADIRHKITQLSHSGVDEIEQMGVLDRQLGQLFAAATLELLTCASILPAQVRAIGSHGQTIRHRPPSGENTGTSCFTLQIGDPNTIAEITGITTVADFRRRDIAAGGEGAPLAPAFHAAAFSCKGVNRAIVNIGGFANITILAGSELLSGFDTGPGNTLLDHWILRHEGKPFDQDGIWSAGGEVLPELLERFLSHPYFAKTGPRSTGKEAFNLGWLEQCLGGLSEPSPQDVQATLAELTAISIARGAQGSDVDIAEMYICGGGAHNTDLRHRLQRHLPQCALEDTRAIGMHPDWVEAATFAWLASRSLEAMAGNAPVVTGAAGPRILGGIYPGSH